jgi:glycosyltransferase involved in cell wall biosynthesis
VKISILLPNFNHAQFLGQAIGAVQAQTYQDWQLAVVDDASTDDSRAIIEDIARRDQRIVTRFLPENQGVVAALRTAYEMTDAPLVFGTAADDYLIDDHFLEKAVRGFKEAPGAACAFARVQLQDEETGADGYTLGRSPRQGYIEPREALRTFFNGRLFVHGAAVVWKRSDVDRVGGYDAELGPLSDFFIHHALAALSGACFVDGIATLVRVAPNKYSQSITDEQYFRGYARVEQRIRALELGYRIPSSWPRRWRKRIINERYAARWQRRFFDAIRPALERLRVSWETPILPPDLREPVQALGAGLDRWSDDLEKRVGAAEAIFREVAGPLPGEALDRWLRRVKRG